MFDCHCHCFLSDGELLPSELVRRVEVLGYSAVAITDHADASNMDHIIPRIVEAARVINPHSETRLIPGIELTHVHPAIIGEMAIEARRLGAQVVVCHGETIVEPVAPGTNAAALRADIDILAHPGLLTDDEAALAAERGVFLELSGRKGHCLTNGHVALMAARYGAGLIINSDGHAPGDFMTRRQAEKVGLGAGLEPEQVRELYGRAWDWLGTLPALHA